VHLGSVLLLLHLQSPLLSQEKDVPAADLKDQFQRLLLKLA
jgi:hypothetical protein